jgi:hypothetical protein
MIPVPNIKDRVPELLNRIIPHYNIQPEEQSDTPDLISILGTPVYSNLQFKMVSGTSLDNSLNVGGQGSDSDVILRIDTCLITVTQDNIINSTEIQGGRPVLEYIGQSNYNIMIQGELVTQFSNVFPHDELSLLNELCNLKKPLPIASNFLNIFSIDTLVVIRPTFGERPGGRNSVPFQLECISDYPLEFKLNDTSFV